MTLSRFRHLERPRRDEPDAADAATPRRFDLTEPPAAGEPEPAVPALASQRFASLLPTEPASLELAEAEDSQPFVRCGVCEADNSLFVDRCSRCRAQLDTPEQRAFNERLWAVRQEERREQEEALARIRDEQAKLGAEAAAARRRMGELLAQKVHDDTLQRNRDWLHDPAATPPSLGVRWLRRLPDPRMRLAVIALIAATCAGLVFLTPRGSRAESAGLWLSVLVFVLFAPGGWRLRRRWWD